MTALSPFIPAGITIDLQRLIPLKSYRRLGSSTNTVSYLPPNADFTRLWTGGATTITGKATIITSVCGKRSIDHLNHQTRTDNAASS